MPVSKAPVLTASPKHARLRTPLMSNHAAKYRFLLNLSAIAITLASASCNQASPARYDRTTSIIVKELFRAIHLQQHELAIDKLSRLQELKPDCSMIPPLIKIENENRLMSKVIGLLEANNFAAALREFDETVKRQGISDHLLQERGKIEFLSTVIRYQEQLPFQTAVLAQQDLSAHQDFPVPQESVHLLLFINLV